MGAVSGLVRSGVPTGGALSRPKKSRTVPISSAPPQEEAGVLTIPGTDPLTVETPLFFFDLEPCPRQREMLEKLVVERGWPEN